MALENGYRIVETDLVDQDLIASYDELPVDTHANVAGRYRRYANFKIRKNKKEGSISITRLLDRPFFQTRKFSTVYGGRPITFPAIDQKAVVPEIIANLTEYVPLMDAKDYFVRCHKIRTEISDKAEGKVSPEGPHQDGLDFIVMVAVARQNIQGGVSNVYTMNKSIKFSKELSPGEALIIHDVGQYHAVSDITLEAGHSKGARDMLLWGYQEWEESYYFHEYGDLLGDQTIFHEMRVL